MYFMKKVLLSAIACVALAGTTYASTGEVKKPELADKTESLNLSNNAPVAEAGIPCTVTLNFYEPGKLDKPVGSMTIVSESTANEDDCCRWGASIQATYAAAYPNYTVVENTVYGR